MTDIFPLHYPIPAGRPLLIMSCSAVKRPVGEREWLPFGELYDGPTWRQVRASGFPMTSVAAISALYGFLEPGHTIRTYDRKIDEDISRRFCTESNDVARIARAIEIAGAAFVVGGQLYQAVARAAVRFRPQLAGDVAFASGSYLRQRKQLGEWLRANRDRQAA